MIVPYDDSSKDTDEEETEERNGSPIISSKYSSRVRDENSPQRLTSPSDISSPNRSEEQYRTSKSMNDECCDLSNSGGLPMDLTSRNSTGSKEERVLKSTTFKNKGNS